jgi:Asp-tRNA(Asn)/Glu-tRNA(Gln) amidotransferase A subunit family amidase
MSDLLNVSTATLAKLIRNKEASSEEVVNAHLRRIETVNPKLNAAVIWEEACACPPISV